MIEVEKKFILLEEDMARLTDGAKFLGEYVFTDTYYDAPDWALSKNDMWLRERDGKWELKIPKHQGEGILNQQYQEVEGEDSIRQVFGIAPEKSFLEDIHLFGYGPFCQCTTTRKKYTKEGFVIDLDDVEFFSVEDGTKDFKYAVGEIELMVETQEEVGEAIERIEKFAELQNLKSAPVRGKVYEYIKRKKPEHYHALIEAGIVNG